MNSILYLKYILKSHRGFLIFSAIFIALVQFMLIEIFTGMDTKPFITSVFELMPEKFRILIGEQFFSHLTVDGAAAFGFNHPMILAIFAIVVISITTKHIAGEIEKGTMELMLSLPIKRTYFVFRLWFISALITLFLIAFALFGAYLGVSIFGEFTYDFMFKISKIGISLWFLIILIMSFSLMISTFEREASKAVGKSSIVIIIFYFLDFLSTAWEPLAFTKTFNIFTYYQPQKLMFGNRHLIDNLPVLCILIILCLGISVWQFNRRDIP